MADINKIQQTEDLVDKKKADAEQVYNQASSAQQSSSYDDIMKQLDALPDTKTAQVAKVERKKPEVSASYDVAMSELDALPDVSSGVQYVEKEKQPQVLQPQDTVQQRLQAASVPTSKRLTGNDALIAEAEAERKIYQPEVYETDNEGNRLGDVVEKDDYRDIHSWENGVHYVTRQYKEGNLIGRQLRGRYKKSQNGKDEEFEGWLEGSEFGTVKDKPFDWENDTYYPFLNNGKDVLLIDVGTETRNIIGNRRLANEVWNKDLSEIDIGDQGRYEKMSKEQLVSEWNSLADDYDQGRASNTDVKRAQLVWEELLAREFGFTTAQEMRNNPGKRDRFEYEKWFRDNYGSEDLDTFLKYGASKSNNPLRLNIDKFNSMEVEGDHSVTYYRNKLLSDPQVQKEFLSWALARADQENIPINVAVKKGVEEFASWVDDAIIKVMQEEFNLDNGFGLFAANALANNSIGEIYRGIVKSPEFNKYFDKAVQESMKKQPAWAQALISVGPLLPEMAVMWGGGEIVNAGLKAAVGSRAAQAAAKAGEVLSKKARTEAFMKFMATGTGRAASSSLNFAFLNEVGAIAADVKNREFNFMGHVNAIGRGLVMGAIMSGSGSLMNRILPTYRNKLTKYVNNTVRFLAEGGTFASAELMELAINGNIGEDGKDKGLSGSDIGMVMLNNGAMVLFFRGTHLLRGKNPFRQKSATGSIKELEERGYTHLADELKRRDALINSGKETQPLSEDAREELNQLNKDMNDPRKGVSWSAYSDALRANNLLLGQSAEMVRTEVKEVEGGYRVEGFDINGRVIKGKFFKSQKDAESFSSSLRKEIKRAGEIESESLYDMERERTAVAIAARRVADQRNEGQQPYLGDGTPNPEYTGTTAAEVFYEYKTAINTPASKRTPEQALLVADFDVYRNEAVKNSKSTDDLKKLVCDQFGVSTAEFDVALDNNHAERRKGAPVTKAIEAYYDLVGKGFHNVNDEPIGVAKLKDGREINVVNEVEVNEAMLPTDERGNIYYRDADGSVQVVSASEITELKYDQAKLDVEREAQRIDDLSVENRNRKYNEGLDEYRKQLTPLSDEDLARWKDELSKRLEDKANKEDKESLRISLKLIDEEIESRKEDKKGEEEQSKENDSSAAATNDGDAPIRIDGEGDVIEGENPIPEEEPVVPIEISGSGEVIEPEQKQPTETPKAENEMQPVKTPEAESNASTPKDKIDELLDAMGFEKKEERDEQRAFYADKNNAEQFEKDYNAFVGKKTETVDDSQQEVKAVDPLDEPMPKDDKGKVMMRKASTRRTRKYLYEDLGLSKKDADSIVEYELDKATKAQEDYAQEKKRPTIKDKGIEGDPEKLKQKLDEYEKAAQAAQEDVRYWEEVKRMGEEPVEPESKPEPSAQNAGEANTVGNEVKEKWNNAPKVYGKSDTMRLENGTKLNGRYVLAPSGSVSASHDANNNYNQTPGFPVDANGNTANSRDYKGNASYRQTTERHGENYNENAIQDRVVVSKDGVVLSGNGRTMAGELAARYNTDKEYVDYLREHAEDFGFTKEQVYSMEHPRVVFEIQEDLPYTAETFDMFNKGKEKVENKTEAAVRLGKTTPPETITRVLEIIDQFDNIGDFNNNNQAPIDVLRELASAGVITQNEINALMENGKLSPQGKDFIENLLVGNIFAGEPDAVRILSNNPDVRQKVVTGLSALTSNARLGDGFSLVDEITTAIKLIANEREGNLERGSTVQAITTSFDFGEDYGSTPTEAFTNQLVITLTEMLNGKRVREFKEFLDSYNNEAEVSAGGETRMFGNLGTKEEIFNFIIDNFKNGRYKKSRDARAGAGQGETERAGDEETGSSAQNPQADAGEERLRQLQHELEEAAKALDRVEAEWDERIRDYIAEKYPTQANVTAETNSVVGRAERAAMDADPVLKKMREDADAAIKEADDYLGSKIKEQEAAERETKGNGQGDDIRFRDGEGDAGVAEPEDGNTPTFYSNAARAVEGIKQNKATAEQWLAMIKKAGGLKAGEDKWMGLSQWLEDNKGKSLTKEEVQQFIADNGIEMEETTYSEVPQSFDSLKREYDQWLRDEGFDYAQEQLRERFGDDADIAFNDLGGELVIANEEAAAALLGSGDIINQTRLDYTTKGLDNKREIAFKVPNIEPYQEHDEIHFGPENQGKAVMWVRFGETTGVGYSDGGKKRAEFEKIAAENEQWYKDHPQFAKYGVGDASLKQESEARKERQRKALEEAKATEVPARVLVIDEIQSNRHQDARESGYKSEYANSKRKAYREALDAITAFNKSMKEKYGEFYLNDMLTAEEEKEYERLYKALKETGDESATDKKTYDIPDAPFEKNWHEVAMKRMLRLAAEEGFDKVAWTTGEQQAERYNIGNVVNRIVSEPYEAQSPTESNGHDLFVALNDGTMYEMFVQPDGTLNSNSETFDGKNVRDVFGKELGERISSATERTELSGEGLRVGGEGMKGFYDQMLPRFMDKYGKKWGVKTGEVQLATPGKEVMHAVDVTPEMKESVMQGQPLFRTSKELDEQYPTWLSGQTTDSGQHTTQITSTVKSYNRIGEWMKKNGMEGASVLDASSGLGVGTQALRGMGFNVDDVEPYPSKDREAPTYQKYEDIDKEYDVVISNAVLNVIPDDWRADVLKSMADKLKVGGKLIINVRDSKSIENQKQKIELDSPSEILVTDSKGNIRAYQKGFTKNELKDWVKSELGEGWEVEIANESNSGLKSGVAVVVTRGESAAPVRYRTFEPLGERGVKRVTQVREAEYRDARDYFGNPTRLQTRSAEYKVEGMGDTFRSVEEAADAVRRRNPDYCVYIDNEGNIRLEAWSNLLPEGMKPNTYAKVIALSGGEMSSAMKKRIASYVEREMKQARVRAEEITKELGLDVEFHDDPSEFTGRKAKAKGWYDPKTGKIHIVMGNHSGVSDVMATMLHEGVAHHGLRKLFGEDFNTFLDNVHNNVSEDMRTDIDGRIEKMRAADEKDNVTHSDDYYRRAATEEYLADLAEDGLYNGEQNTSYASRAWQWIKENFINMLRKAGINIELSDDELRYILWSSHKNLRRGAEAMAEDAVMREKAGIKDYVEEGEPVRKVADRDAEPADVFNVEREKIELDGRDSALIGLMGRDDSLSRAALRDFISRHEERYDQLKKKYEGQFEKDLAGLRENWDAGVEETWYNALEKLNDDMYKGDESELLDRLAQADALADELGPIMAAEPEVRYGDKETMRKQQESKNFKDWFGDWENDPENASKVVDKEGRPLVVYHGTLGDFNTFRRTNDIGFHFGTKGTARARVGRKGKVMPVYLDIKSPIRIEQDFGSWDADYMLGDYLVENGIISQDELNKVLYSEKGYKLNTQVENKALRDLLLSKGYDGIIYNNWYEANNKLSYIVFRPNQIKSAEENNGDFSRENPDIRFRDGEEGGRDYAAEMRELMRRRLRGEDVTAELEQLRADRRAEEAMRAGNNGAGSGEPPVEPPTPPAPATPEPAPELPPTGYDRPMSPIEMAQEAAIKVVADTKASLEQRNTARRELDASLRNLHKAMRLQKEYDRATVENVVSLCKTMVSSGLIDHRYISNLTPLFTKLKDANGKQDLTSTVNGIMDVMLKSQERSIRNELNTLLNTKAQRVNQSGVVTQGGVDLRGQRTLQSLSENFGKSVEDIDRRITQLEDLRGRIPENSEERLNEVDDKIQGALLAKAYIETAKNHEDNITAAEEELAEIKAQYKDGELGLKEYTEQKHALEAQIRSYRMSHADAMWDYVKTMRGIVAEGRSRAKDFIEAQKAHKNEIRHNAYSDMAGTPQYTQSRPGGLAKAVNSSVSQFVSSSLYTLDTMLRQLGHKHAKGEGYLYERFGRGWLDARDNEIRDYWADREELDKKTQELFGVKHFANLIDAIRKMPKMDVPYKDGGDIKNHTLDQAQLMYIYMVNKMEDGIVKLRRMGISEEDVETIKNFMNPKLVELADWLQNDFLPSRREGYNEVHRRMFGADMDMVENYVPLRIDKGNLTETVDINNGQNEPSLASTVTGGIIKRTHNTTPIDIMGTNAIDMILDHLDEMNHWKNFAEWNRDVNTLLSDKTFRNKVKNTTTIYGSGDKLWKHLKDVFFIAGGTYKPKGEGIDKAMVNIAKGVSAAKVSFRMFTATKQLLSLPVFAANCNVGYMVKNMAKPAGSWNWCMENLPSFKQRWKSRIAGDTRLEDTDIDWQYTHKKWVEKASKWGLSPNAFVDAMTVAVGARSVYEQRYKRYRKDGYDDVAADRRARQDATAAFNQTQQSSEKMFVAPMQVDRTLLAVGASLFRNASMGYERQFVEGLRNLKHLFGKERVVDEDGNVSTVSYKKASIEFMKKQMERNGLTETQAESAAKRIYNRSIWRNALKLAMFGFGAQMAWNVGGKLPYLAAQGYNAIFGDDDERKQAGTNAWDTTKEALWHAAAGGWLEGLPFGNVVSDGINNEINGENFFKFSPDLLPFFGDTEDVANHFDGKNKLRGATDLVNLGAQMFIGVNPQTFLDIMTGIVDITAGKKQSQADFGTAKEALLLTMRIMQCPQSQLDQLYIDELGMNARQAQSLTPEQVARRYAFYKAHHDVPYLWHLYNQEKQDELIKQYEKNFNKKLNDDVKEAGGTPEDYHDLMESSTTTAGRNKYRDKEIAALSEQGPEALMKAWEKERNKGLAADYKYMKSLMTRYQKDVYGKGKTPDEAEEAELYQETHGEDIKEQALKIGRDLGFGAQDSYFQMSQYKAQHTSAKDPVMKDFTGNGGGFKYSKDGKFFKIEEYPYKVPVKDPAKRAKALKVIKDHKEELRRNYRNGWRMAKIKALYKDIEAESLKKERDHDKMKAHFAEIIQILEDERKDAAEWEKKHPAKK